MKNKDRRKTRKGGEKEVEEEDEEEEKDEEEEEEEEKEEDEDESFLQKIERNLKEETSEIDENKLYNIIFDIVKYLSYHDVREMRDILDELSENTMIEEEVEELKKLIPTFLDNMYTDISPIKIIINEIENRDKNIPKTLLLRFMILLKEFRRNHIRVTDIANMMNRALSHPNPKEVSDTVERLLRGRLISHEQFTKLRDMIDELDMKKLIEIVASEKIGRGIDFLPRKTKDLKKKLYDWAISYSDKPQPDLKSKIIALLDELRFRKALTEGKYNDILKDMN